MRQQQSSIFPQLNSHADMDTSLKPALLYQQLMELIPQIVWLADAQGAILNLNSAWQRYTGETVEASQQRGIWQFLHPEDQLRLTTNWQQAIALNQPFQEKGRLQLVDGSYEWFSIVARPIDEDFAPQTNATWFGMMQRLASAAGDPHLMEGQEFLEALVENVSDAVVACNDKGQLVLFNRAAQDFHGLPPEPISPQEWSQYYDLYDGSGTHTFTPEEIPLLRALKGEKVRDVRMMIIPKGGKARSLIANADPIYSITGQKLGAVVVMRDVTAYREAEIELDLSERRFQAIFNRSFQMIGLLSTDGTLLEVNQTALDFGPFTANEVLNRPFWETRWWDSLNDAERKHLKQSIARAADGEFIRYEVDLRDANSQTVSIDFTLKPVFDRHGKVILVIPEARDITAQKTATTELRALTAQLEARVAARTADLEAAIQQLEQQNSRLEEREAQFRATFEQVAMGAAHVDLSGHWLRVNDKLCQIVGYSEAELLQRTFQEITYPEDLDSDLAMVQQLLDGKLKSYSLEKRYIHKNGGLIWVNITVTLLRRAVDRVSNQPLYFLAMIEDISDRKALELRESTSRAALERAKADLEQRNDELDQFVYMASHDLKAPLRGIANLSEWLEEDLGGQLPEDNQAQLVLMRQRVKRMEALINGLLQYSRVGREQIDTETVNVQQLILEVIDSLAPPPTFILQFSQSMPHIAAKRLLMRQVFANLISNAIKHHDREEGKIEIGWQDAEQYYHFSVTDDGPGIPLEQQQQVFGIFHTLNPSDAPENTGIGLAIIRKIVEAEGGTITVHSNPERGCRFEFTWPKQAN
ncbi:PAS domain S-box protein [filamentous cyanobacterium LEGE 11480]|uniref:histidine kinase n=1 Tax=Romeriopsis navalis LEGE 11480 TaxID=2777977 RepID=A0A928VPH7_9CYAN|nr:PAS domain S-box protein [Romeriopsis navalis]MBE9031433.1 PAS domain S-box protein [Romeriopsis navalis LEGE 11480]